MKKLLVLGGFGYIGAHFINRLKGYEVAVVETFVQGRNNIIKGIKCYEVDIRDKKNLVRVFKDFKPDAVVHYAALARGNENNGLR